MQISWHSQAKEKTPKPKKSTTDEIFLGIQMSMKRSLRKLVFIQGL